jgi:hypothetical protein
MQGPTTFVLKDKGGEDNWLKKRFEYGQKITISKYPFIFLS